MKRVVIVVALVALALGAVPLFAADANAYQALSKHYEAMRQALLHDGTKGVSEHALAFEKISDQLQAGFSAEKAGIRADQKADLMKILPDLSKAASDMAATKDLDAAREAFVAFSVPMVKYRNLVGDSSSAVVYCSMKKKTWVQPKGEIGNPYLGQKMATCGQIVSN
ncbi:MAG: DUF3347 domain-containing protein [Thermoanaerobaculia bacterium]